MLRIPTALVLAIPVPFNALTLVLAATSDGVVRVVGLLVGVATTVASVAFGVRRHHVLHAVDEPDRLATELGILVSLSDRSLRPEGRCRRSPVVAVGGCCHDFADCGRAWV